jgi:hypothetical protein
MRGLGARPRRIAVRQEQGQTDRSGTRKAMGSMFHEALSFVGAVSPSEPTGSHRQAYK